MRNVLKLMVWLGLSIFHIDLAAKEMRVALVIGNSNYLKSPLANPVNDARDMSDKLRHLGFEVIERDNIKMKHIGSTLNEFRNKIKPGAVALIFYAGHGIQIKGENYLPAVDAEITVEEDVPNQSISMRQILDLLDESKTRLNLVFLDACRNNPYSRSFRSAAGGLARVVAPSGTLISYATRPGSVAADGDGHNGLYTSKLLKQLNSTQPIELALKAVVSEVKNDSLGKQEPWTEGSIEGEFCFAGCAANSSTAQAMLEPIKYEPAPIAAESSKSVEAAKYMPSQSEIAVVSTENWKKIAHYQVKEGLVEDSNTGLMWMRCSLGQHWVNSSCQGKPAEYNWDRAMLVASNESYEQYSDWRLPTIDELKSLVQCSSGKTETYSKGRTECDGDYAKPTVEQSAFPQTPLREFWSASSYANGGDETWFINFSTGKNDYDDSDSNYKVIRLVRTSQTVRKTPTEETLAQLSTQTVTDAPKPAVLAAVSQPIAESIAPVKITVELPEPSRSAIVAQNPAPTANQPIVATSAPATAAKTALSVTQSTTPPVIVATAQSASKLTSPVVSLPFTEPEMVSIKAGCFQMGSSKNEADRRANERQHKVCLKNFEIGKYEVTQAQWQAVMGENLSHFKGHHLPVEQVSWDEVQTFIEKLNAKTGKNYRLPTEAEWEYAARAGTTSAFYTGNCMNADQTNYDGKHEYTGCEAKNTVLNNRTTEVGTYPPNKWDLYDMAGNVWEWTCSAYVANYNGSETQCSGSSVGERAIRGGSWSDELSNLRSAYRAGSVSDDRGASLGFRLAKNAI